MINGTDYPACGHGAAAQVPALGCAACLSNQRDAAAAEAAHLRVERDEIRSRLHHVSETVNHLSRAAEARANRARAEAAQACVEAAREAWNEAGNQPSRSSPPGYDVAAMQAGASIVVTAVERAAREAGAEEPTP